MSATGVGRIGIVIDIGMLSLVVFPTMMMALLLLLLLLMVVVTPPFINTTTIIVGSQIVADFALFVQDFS